MGLTTQQARNAYPELVVGGVSSSWVVYSNGPKCDWRSTVGIVFPAGGPYGSGTVTLRVHPSVAEAAQALSAVMVTWNYLFRETAGGSLSCRKITGGTRTTLHSHGVAIDFNPSKNRYTSVGSGLIQWGRQTDMPKGMVKDIEAIRTKNGKAVWQWGGRWWNIKDAMHYQSTKCSRNDIETGINWNTVNGQPGQMEDEVIVRSTRGTLAKDFQRYLNNLGYTDAGGNKLTVDGFPGDKTFQAWNKGLKAAGDLPAQAKPNEYANDPLMNAVTHGAGGTPATHDHDGRYLKGVTGNK